MRSKLLPVMNDAFFGLKLRTGSVVISVVLFFVFSIYLVESLVQLKNTYYGYESIYMNRYGGMYETDLERAERMNNMKMRQLTNYSVGALISSLFSVLSAVFLIGVYKKSPRLMCPGIVVISFSVYFAIFTLFMTAWDMGINRYVFQNLCYMVCGYYCFLVLYNYYQQLLIASLTTNSILSKQILTQEEVLNKDTAMKPNHLADGNIV